MSDDLITELRHHETEYQELVHGPLCGRAADEIERLRIALEIIAGRRQCVDNLMSSAEVAAAALDGRQSTNHPPIFTSEEDGAPRRWILPDGLTGDQIEEAVCLALEWELDDENTATEFVIKLYYIFCPPVSKP